MSKEQEIKISECKMGYNNPEHPEHVQWLIDRRKRFTTIIREGKRACKLLPNERELVIELARIVDIETKRLEKQLKGEK